MTEPEALMLVDKLAAAFPAPRWTPARVELWTDSLVGLDHGAAGTATVRMIHERTHCPTIADFRAAAGSRQHTATAGHAAKCTCNGVGWIEILETGNHGQTYWAWARCPDGPPVAFAERKAPAAGPEMSYHEYLSLKRPPLPLDDDDDEWARRAAWALFTDPDCLPLKPDNPLAGLVEHYVNAYRAQGADASPRTAQAP